VKVTTFQVHAMTCGACGYCASAMTDDGKLAAMMLHLIYRHGPSYGERANV
jgi:hypothetical protein